MGAVLAGSRQLKERKAERQLKGLPRYSVWVLLKLTSRLYSSFSIFYVFLNLLRVTFYNS